MQFCNAMIYTEKFRFEHGAFAVENGRFARVLGQPGPDAVAAARRRQDLLGFPGQLRQGGGQDLPGLGHVRRLLQELLGPGQHLVPDPQLQGLILRAVGIGDHMEPDDLSPQVLLAAQGRRAPQNGGGQCQQQRQLPDVESCIFRIFHK